MTIDNMCMLLLDSGLGHSYWAEVAAYSIYTCNLIPLRQTLGSIPLKLFTGQRKGVNHLQVFGSKCWAKIPTINGLQVMGGSKLEPWSMECHLLRYATGTGNYKVQDVTTCQTFVSCDLVFEEGQPHCMLLGLTGTV